MAHPRSADRNTRVNTFCFSPFPQSEKCAKEIPSRARRLTREMQAYWKRYDRVERETRRRLEKEAEEQRKMDVEYMEVRGRCAR